MKPEQKKKRKKSALPTNLTRLAFLSAPDVDRTVDLDRRELVVERDRFLSFFRTNSSLDESAADRLKSHDDASSSTLSTLRRDDELKDTDNDRFRFTDMKNGNRSTKQAFNFKGLEKLRAFRFSFAVLCEEGGLFIIKVVILRRP
jgi:hypothetical protein